MKGANTFSRHCMLLYLLMEVIL
uniref:Uncharacterized protein n=1 Tax=Anguilla anguilla TaxID=7936 RepID=A0A0E9PT32_ANGAN